MRLPAGLRHHQAVTGGNGPAPSWSLPWSASRCKLTLTFFSFCFLGSIRGLQEGSLFVAWCLFCLCARSVDGRNFEIIDHVELDCQVPSLAEALAVMGASYEKAYRMMNKLGVFN